MRYDMLLVGRLALIILVICDIIIKDCNIANCIGNFIAGIVGLVTIFIAEKANELSKKHVEAQLVECRLKNLENVITSMKGKINNFQDVYNKCIREGYVDEYEVQNCINNTYDCEENIIQWLDYLPGYFDDERCCDIIKQVNMFIKLSDKVREHEIEWYTIRCTEKDNISSENIIKIYDDIKMLKIKLQVIKKQYISFTTCYIH